MNVNKSDFFLHVFDELLNPETDMFMFMTNDNETLAWFPPKVSLFDVILFNLLLPW